VGALSRHPEWASGSASKAERHETIASADDIGNTQKRANRLCGFFGEGIPAAAGGLYCVLMIDSEGNCSRWLAVAGHLDERGRRLFAAAEVRVAGYGGLAAVARITGLARSTIERGRKDLDAPALPAGMMRRPGSGRRPLPATDETLLDDLRRLVEPAMMGDPTRPLLWVSKSWVKLATALQAMGHKVSANTVGKLLPHLGFTRHVNRKTKEGGDHPDRDGQFEYINAQAMAFHAAGQPVISVDTKKKELVGAYKNVGSDYRAEGRPDEVKVHDFVDKELGKAIPYGVYDIGANTGWINVGIDHDTAEFAVNTIRRWYEKMGRERYPKTDCLMITADGRGSHGTRVQLWKVELQKFADRTGLTLHVHMY
jgi:DNA-binding phage protein